MKKFKYLPIIFKLPKFIRNWYELPLIIIKLRNKVVLRNGLEFKIYDYVNLLVLFEIFYNNDYKISLSNPVNIVDIGSNIGDSTIYFSKRFSNTKIYSIEPNNKVYRLQKENLKLNKINNVVTFNQAISDKNGTRDFYLSPASGLSGFTKNNTSSIKVKVKTSNLDSFFKQCSISRCDLLKLDCEGAEFDILLNSNDRTLLKVENFIVEYHDDKNKGSHDSIVQLFRRLKYKVTIKKHAIESSIGIIYAKK